MNRLECGGEGQLEPERPLERPLWVCPVDGCGSKFMQAVDWYEESRSNWYVRLWCPECEGTVEGVYSEDRVSRLDDELDRGAAELAAALGRVVHDNMRQEVKFFTRVLNADIVTADDFKR